jgi:lysozyme
MTIANHFQRQGGRYSAAGAWVGICIACTAGFEGYASKPYVDRVGTGHPITWCYGETGADGPIPAMGTTFTKAQCSEQLGIQLTKKYDPEIKRCLKPEVYDALPPHRHAALVSFTYNVGGGAFCKSSVARNLNSGRPQQACNALMGYTHAGGVVVQGLVNRRRAERELCLMED